MANSPYNMFFLPLLGVFLLVSHAASQTCYFGGYYRHCPGGCCYNRCCHNHGNYGIIVAILLTVAMCLSIVIGVVVVCVKMRPRTWGVPTPAQTQQPQGSGPYMAGYNPLMPPPAYDQQQTPVV